jgi:DNA-binding transcriptional regulator GbsR (MarR family)
MPDLSAVQKKFILHWGEMGTRWGINRTVAQVHALLYLSAKPLDAEDIAKTLGVARSNVSTSLRELQGWGIVRVTHLLGDRRDHFVTMTDVWEMFRIILEERKRKEIDPTLGMLRECLAEVGREGTADAYTRGRVAAMLEFMENMQGIYEEAVQMSPGTLKGILKMRGKLRGLLGKKGAKSGAAGRQT